MKRNIISIEQEKCTGCGACIPDCPEGALQIIDGKARLISDLFCDGLGACIKACPTGAMTIEERDAEPYNEKTVMQNIIAQGPNTIHAHLSHLRDHGETELLRQACEVLEEKGIPVPAKEEKVHHAGCPGSMMRDMRNRPVPASQPVASTASQLTQWPVQLALVNPSAPYFDNDDLLITADCVPFAYANYHDRFLKGKPVVVFCPKLDANLDRYIDKLAQIITNHPIRTVTVLRMEVPCCGGATHIAEEAVRRAAKGVIIREHTISLQGEIM